jgi:hypothetical protein
MDVTPTDAQTQQASFTRECDYFCVRNSTQLRDESIGGKKFTSASPIAD